MDLSGPHDLGLNLIFLDANRFAAILGPDPKKKIIGSDSSESDPHLSHCHPKK